MWIIVLLAASVARADPVATCTSAGGAADCSSWFRADVTVSWSATDTTVTGCPDQLVPAPPAGATTTIQAAGCTADDGTTSLGPEIRIDLAPPGVTAPPPDVNGWYTAPVTLVGSDVGSGLASCAPATYSGPDSSSASLPWTCTDVAGNVGSGTFVLAYDATPPTLSGLKTVRGDRSVAVVWSTDGVSAEVLRVPGVGEPASVVFTGPGDSFVDTQVSNGTTYTYRVTVRDPAGHASTQSVVAVAATPEAAPAAGGSPVTVLATLPPVGAPKPPRIRPAPRSVLAAGHAPLLRWPASERARYYNVQLYRNGRKVLSGWPSRPRYRLKLRWIYKHTQRRLRPGRYRWMVWPGLGPRVHATYGTRMVNSTFVVRRRPPPAGIR